MIDANTLSVIYVSHQTLGLSPTIHLVKHEDVPTMVEAIKALHSGACINPYSKMNTSRADAIYVIKLSDIELAGPYWWTSPTLNEHGGVPVGDLLPRTEHRVWSSDSGDLFSF